MVCLDRATRPTRPLADAHAGLVDGFGLEPFGGTQFQCVIVAEQIDRAHFGTHAVGNQVGDVVQTLLTACIFGQRIAQATE